MDDMDDMDEDDEDDEPTNAIVDHTKPRRRRIEDLFDDDSDIVDIVSHKRKVGIVVCLEICLLMLSLEAYEGHTRARLRHPGE